MSRDELKVVGVIERHSDGPEGWVEAIVVEDGPEGNCQIAIMI
jgi:hypothetical protein